MRTRLFIVSLKLMVFPMIELVNVGTRLPIFLSHDSFMFPSNVPAGKPRWVRATLKGAVSVAPLLKAVTICDRGITVYPAKRSSGAISHQMTTYGWFLD